jgi:hypothetical protein
MNSLSRHRAIAAAALALGLSPLAVHAQATQGGLEGSAPPGDSVSILNPETGHRLVTGVADNGRFHFRRLPIGIYEVVIHHADGSMDDPILARARVGEIVQVN